MGAGARWTNAHSRLDGRGALDVGRDVEAAEVDGFAGCSVLHGADVSVRGGCND